MSEHSTKPEYITREANNDIQDFVLSNLEQFREILEPLISEDMFIAGGIFKHFQNPNDEEAKFIPSQNSYVKDIDIFFATEEAYKIFKENSNK